MQTKNSNSHESFPTARDLAEHIDGERKGVESYFSEEEVAAFEAVSHYNQADRALGELLVHLEGMNGQVTGEVEELALEAYRELEEASNNLEAILAGGSR